MFYCSKLVDQGIYASAHRVASICTNHLYCSLIFLPISGSTLVLTSYWCLFGILQQKYIKRDETSIDRQNDTEILRNFNLDYKSCRRVDDMQQDQRRMRKLATFITKYIFVFGYNLLFVAKTQDLSHFI